MSEEQVCPKCGRTAAAIRLYGHRPPCTRSTAPRTITQQAKNDKRNGFEDRRGPR